ncbi:MAG: hypothetical protein J6U68_00425 [Clostridia bacterium]|nr:hypothetical protein [Clostridia bacterium]
MNGILPTELNKRKTSKVLILCFLLLCVLPTILNITCLTPIYYTLETNTLYSGGAITLTLKYVMDLLDIISFGTVYATAIFSLVLLKKKTTVLISISYIAMLLLKIPARLLMNIPIYGSIGTTGEIIADIITLSFYFILEVLQYLIVLIFASVIAKKYIRAVTFLDSKKNKKDTQIKAILPIKKFINWYNPLLRASVFSSITVFVMRALSRLVTDIGAGAPTSFGEVLIVIVNYLTDAVYGAVVYVIAIFMFNLLFEKLTKDKRKADEVSPSAQDNI